VPIFSTRQPDWKETVKTRDRNRSKGRLRVALESCGEERNIQKTIPITDRKYNQETGVAWVAMGVTQWIQTAKKFRMGKSSHDPTNREKKSQSSPRPLSISAFRSRGKAWKNKGYPAFSRGKFSSRRLGSRKQL